ncbi:MAG: hypothetical protein E7356_01560 [Clostridiales bacterium]|nr:hypothetical protein [Clostridiales bacterium]
MSFDELRDWAKGKAYELATQKESSARKGNSTRRSSQHIDQSKPRRKPAKRKLKKSTKNKLKKAGAMVATGLTLYGAGFLGGRLSVVDNTSKPPAVYAPQYPNPSDAPKFKGHFTRNYFDRINNVLYWWSDTGESVGSGDKVIQGEQTTAVETTEQVTEPVQEQVKDESRITCENFYDYCFNGRYGGDSALICPQDVIVDLARQVIDDLNAKMVENGNEPIFDGGEYISYEEMAYVLTALCYRESSYVVELRGEILTNKVSGTNQTATGILQQIERYVDEANRLATKYGLEGYSYKDREDPIKSFEMTALVQAHYYNSYISPTGTSSVYHKLCPEGNDSDALVRAMLLSHNAPSDVVDWLRNKKGYLGILKNPDSGTPSYGQGYLANAYNAYVKIAAKEAESEDSMGR